MLRLIFVFHIVSLRFESIPYMTSRFDHKSDIFGHCLTSIWNYSIVNVWLDFIQLFTLSLPDFFLCMTLSLSVLGIWSLVGIIDLRLNIVLSIAWPRVSYTIPCLTSGSRWRIRRTWTWCRGPPLQENWPTHQRTSKGRTQDKVTIRTGKLLPPKGKTSFVFIGSENEITIACNQHIYRINRQTINKHQAKHACFIQ